ncbi:MULTISPECIES: helix-turn-helix domain-containing protein [unclassified Erwinia]|uniref:ROK family transcriptional regulator n=1 Tax=unclassified Erwinia TaxID=2622719 RepID=UPI0006F806FC|nr:MULTISPECIES: helix-turn-helix domain-containing protein [unclassified Erwinia]KQN61777.1 NagC family transcriptional regulator [Erwinia sp. Leaf53]PLV54268.1 NagC family transcriptional regulator [Erwinia sp. B116]
MDYKKQILNILHSENASRAEMTRRLGVTKAYITKLTAQLLAEGLIEEREMADVTFGRPQQRLAVKSGSLFSINIMLRKSSLQATLNDYQTQAAPLASHQILLPARLAPDELVAFTEATIAALCAVPRVARSRVRVVSLALQGGIEQDTGVVRYCPLFRETHVNLRALIEAATGIVTRIYNIAHCTNSLLAKRSQGESYVAFMPGFGSLGYGYSTHGVPGLGENGFYPEIVHLPWPGGIEQAFNVTGDDRAAGVQRTAEALFFAICCTAPIHNIRLVIATGELFEDYGDAILPLTRQMLDASPNPHIREIRIRHAKTGYHYGVTGLVQLSAEAITELL